MPLQPINNAPALPSPDDIPTTISAPAGVDIWRKPPSCNVANAPCYIETFPAQAFLHARVTVKADWARLYDQGGLILFSPGWPEQSMFVKAGVELYDGRLWVSAVTGRDGADWSLFPMSSDGQEEVTIVLEREREGKGTSLYVYLEEEGKRTIVRKTTWVFKDEYLNGDISVGIYAARPTKLNEEDGEVLNVSFNRLQITKQSLN